MPPSFVPSTRRRRKRGQQQTQALGRSRGGFTTKIHAVCDALGNPLRFIVTGGERHDCTQAQALLDGVHAPAVLADKGYDADELVPWIQQTGAVVVIPPRSNRTILRDYDNRLYKERNLVETQSGGMDVWEPQAVPSDRRDTTRLRSPSCRSSSSQPATYSSSKGRQTLVNGPPLILFKIVR